MSGTFFRVIYGHHTGGKRNVTFYWSVGGFDDFGRRIYDRQKHWYGRFIIVKTIAGLVYFTVGNNEILLSLRRGIFFCGNTSP